MDPIKERIDIILADAYIGKKVKVQINRKAVCVGCNGIGGTDASSIHTCPTCNGVGKTTVNYYKDDMYKSEQKKCEACDGSGKFIKKEMICKDCKGNKTIN